MSVIQGNSHGQSAVIAYPIANSLRLRSSASAYLSRTFGTPTDGKKWTFSFKIKRGTLGTAMAVFGATSGTDTGLVLDATDTYSFGYGGNWRRHATRVERDPIGQAQVDIVFDSANATEADRLIYYFNGTRITWPVSTSVALNDVTAWNSAGVVGYIGKNLTGFGVGYFDGLLSEIYFIDGQALTPSSFGQADPNNPNNWVPKAYTGTYGNNGFYLKFNDGSNLTNLGLDRSGNGNNWTLNNVSLTAGATYDWFQDTPTIVFNSLTSLDLSSTSYAALSAANLRASFASGAGTGAIGSPIYFDSTYPDLWAEATIVTSAGQPCIGILKEAQSIAAQGSMSMAGNANAVTYYSGSKNVFGTTGAYGATFASTDVIGIKVSPANGTIEFFKQTGGSGAWNSQGVISFTFGTGRYRFVCSGYNGDVIDWTFGQRPFGNTSLPSGAKALDTANRPASSTITLSGTFTGNLNADGPFVWMGGAPATLTINGNAVTWGTHADKTAGGFKLRTASSSYNNTGSNTWTATGTVNFGKSNTYPGAAQGNP